MLTCPKCGATGTLMIEPFMRGSCDASGGRFNYFRCGNCLALVSHLTATRMSQHDSAEPAHAFPDADVTKHQA